MGYYVNTSSCGGGTQPSYTCNNCPTIEYGRIRSAFLVKRSYYSTLLASITTASAWTTGVSSADIIMIPQTQGSYDGGAVQELTGFGDSATMNGNTTHTAEFTDVNYADNCDFWNAIRDSREYIFGYRTSSMVHIPSSGAVATITPKNTVADDINSVVGWKVTAKWTDPDSPCGYTTPTTVFTQCIMNS